jgi:hypothetical protein
VAFKMKKTEHAGAKKGRGAYWGLKRDAKRESNKGRRAQDTRECNRSESGTEVPGDISERSQ